MTTTLTLKLLEDPDDGQRYMRVIDTTDILRSIARNLDKIDLCDGVEIADKIRGVASELEDAVAAYPKAKA